MKTVCVVTASRSEYGLLRPMMRLLKNSDVVDLKIIVTGSHLSPEHGMTIHDIEEDGFYVDKKVEMLLSTKTSVGIIKSMGLCSIGFADALDELHPDLLVVLGDRYELLPICSSALLMGIPIAHLSGGDITMGAIDDQIRNAITMMSSLHFPGTRDSAERIIKMIGTGKNVFPVGEPGLDNFYEISLMSREELANSLSLDIDKKWILLTLHPETKQSLTYNLLMAKNLITALSNVSGCEIVITKANADIFGNEINTFFSNVTASKKQFSLYSSLGQRRYLSFMKEVDFLIGNSSSGIVEAPFLGKPVINIGDRQLGRHICKNVICCSSSLLDIQQALDMIDNHRIIDTFYGDGCTSTKLLNHILYYLENK